MPTIAFTAALRRHIGEVPPTSVSGSTLAEVLDAAFEARPQTRTYVVDDQGRIRKHVAVFIDGQLVTERTHLDVPIAEDAQVYIMQALSGG